MRPWPANRGRQESGPPPQSATRGYPGAMTRGSYLPAAGSRDHAVQFYGDDDELAATVRGYLADGTRILETRSFPFELDSVRSARHFVVGLLETSPDAQLGDDAAIIATELAANAVLHAHSGFTVSVARSASAVRVAVQDSDPLTIRGDGRVPAGDDGVPFNIRQGHGLSVVAQLASAWSVERLPDGKVVWADLTA